MTTATQARPIQADGLRAHELEELRECIHNVQKGLVQYEVLLTNRKQTKSKKRLPGEHYDAHPALAPHAHKGWLVAAPTNREGFVYLHIYDEARAQTRGDGFGHTRVTLNGLRSFEVLRSRPGPLAPDEPIPVAQAPVAQAQALMFAGQALLAQQAQQQSTP